MQASEPFGQKEARKAETRELQYLAEKIMMRKPAICSIHSLVSALWGDSSRLQAIPRVKFSRTSLPEDEYDEDENKDDSCDDQTLTLNDIGEWPDGHEPGKERPESHPEDLVEQSQAGLALVY